MFGLVIQETSLWWKYNKKWSEEQREYCYASKELNTVVASFYQIRTSSRLQSTEEDGMKEKRLTANIIKRNRWIRILKPIIIITRIIQHIYYQLKTLFVMTDCRYPSIPISEAQANGYPIPLHFTKKLIFFEIWQEITSYPIFMTEIAQILEIHLADEFVIPCYNLFVQELVNSFCCLPPNTESWKVVFGVPLCLWRQQEALESFSSSSISINRIRSGTYTYAGNWTETGWWKGTDWMWMRTGHEERKLSCDSDYILSKDAWWLVVGGGACMWETERRRRSR